jgi:hypothetical protein
LEGLLESQDRLSKTVPRSINAHTFVPVHDGVQDPEAGHSHKLDGTGFWNEEGLRTTRVIKEICERFVVIVQDEVNILLVFPRDKGL